MWSSRLKIISAKQTAAGPATSETPLNRVVDAIPLESRAAREFGEMVDKYVASSCHDATLGAQIARAINFVAGQ